MADNNIRSLPGVESIPECPMELISSHNKQLYHCDHASLIIDVHERSIRCAKCGASLDPFDYLAGTGQQIQRAWADYKSVRSRIQDFNESIARLQREEKRLKALVKRLQDKSATKLDVRGGL